MKGPIIKNENKSIYYVGPSKNCYNNYKEKGVDMNKEEKFFKKINISPAVSGLSALVHKIKNVDSGGLDTSPDYQREYVWSQEYRDKLLYSVILNYPVGNIVVNQLQDPNEKGAREELVDGKQRLTTIKRFMEAEDDSEIKTKEVVSDIKKTLIGTLDSSKFNDIDKFKKLKKLKFKDLPEPVQGDIENYMIPVYNMSGSSEEQIREYFKVLQNQEKLRAGEIVNAFPENELTSYNHKYNKEKVTIALNYSDKRNDFEKHFYAIIGNAMGKISMNGPDKNVIKFIEKFESYSGEEKGNILIKVDKYTEAINEISNIECIEKKMTVRALKYILGIAFYCPDYYSNNTREKIIAIEEFSRKLSAFNTSESDENSFIKFYGDEYSCDPEKFKKEKEIEYRKIYHAASKTASKVNFEAACRKLVEIL